MVHCRAFYHVVTPRPAPGIVAIEDRYDGDSMTVTNDAEAVVSKLRELGVLRLGDRLVYRDTEGSWDEMLLNDDLSFAGFHVIGASTVEQATKVIKGGAL